MNACKYLVDTNILIYYLEGEREATDFIKNHFRECGISQINYLEIFSIPLEREEKTIIENFLKLFEVFDINSMITEQAIHNRQSKKIKLADNLIAATAQMHHLTLVTRNVKDFQNLPNLTLFNPFDQ